MRRKASREKRARKLERTPKQAEYGERKSKSSVIKNDKSMYVAQVKHILNFPYDFRKLYLIDSRLIDQP